jgi:hypothetical protein
MNKLSTGKAMSQTNVFEWYHRFRDGRECCEDDSRCGCRSSLNVTLITTVKDVVSWYRRVTICDIGDDTNIVPAPRSAFSQRNWTRKRSALVGFIVFSLKNVNRRVWQPYGVGFFRRVSTFWIVLLPLEKTGVILH